MKLFDLFSITLVLCVFASCNFIDETQPKIEDAGRIHLSPNLQKRVSQDNEFAFDLLKQTNKISGKSNEFVSPLSVSMALGMTWNGANSDTKIEMESALKMSGMTSDEINSYYRIMLDSLPIADKTTKLYIANSIWYKDGFQVNPTFLDTDKKYFDAEIKSLDFSKTWAVDTINGWCAKKTNYLIKDVIKQIDYYARMFLIDAVYFKGAWTHKFDPAKTFDYNFNNEDGSSSTVRMMGRIDTFSYYSDSYAQYLEMPYGNGSFAMTVILPNAGKTTNDVIDYLNADKIESVTKNMVNTQVDVKFPRFKVECSYDLIPELKAMGMNKAFDSNLADFSRMSDSFLYISSVIHKTYVEVTEEGTEAAAVTAVVMTATSMPNYPSFYVNKPFIFLIREKGTGVILFAGKIGALSKY